MTTEPIYRLIYVSSASHLFSKEELVKLLEESRMRNQTIDVTGMLLYKDGNFIQLIEGARAKVQALHAKIAHDPRHGGVVVVFEGEVGERLFSDWSMGFRDLSDPALHALPGFSDFMNRMGSSAVGRRDPDGCLKLLSLFRSSM